LGLAILRLHFWQYTVVLHVAETDVPPVSTISDLLLQLAQTGTTFLMKRSTSELVLRQRGVIRHRLWKTTYCANVDTGRC